MLARDKHYRFVGKPRRITLGYGVPLGLALALLKILDYSVNVCLRQSLQIIFLKCQIMMKKVLSH
jgi:hypothetical protein